LSCLFIFVLFCWVAMLAPSWARSAAAQAIDRSPFSYTRQAAGGPCNVRQQGVVDRSRKRSDRLETRHACQRMDLPLRSRVAARWDLMSCVTSSLPVLNPSATAPIVCAAHSNRCPPLSPRVALTCSRQICSFFEPPEFVIVYWHGWLIDDDVGSREREGLAFGRCSHRLGQLFQPVFYFSFWPPTKKALSRKSRGKGCALVVGFVSLVDFSSQVILFIYPP
jgi:hypothetical protein